MLKKPNDLDYDIDEKDDPLHKKRIDTYFQKLYTNPQIRGCVLGFKNQKLRVPYGMDSGVEL